MTISNINKLALFGGDPSFKKELSTFNSLGDEELSAVNDVMLSGQLSGYYGSWSPEFYGGIKVKQL